MGGDSDKPASAVPHERIAVGISFWIGGIGLAVLKGIAYAATGSAMVRTSLFDSFGDVISTSIMALTQWQMSSSKDAHRYPVGKMRLAPLGVLFFCAFMCSSMSNMAIESIQALVAAEEPDAGAEAASAAVRRLLEDKPRLRWAYGPGRSVEALAAEYGASLGDDSGESDTSMCTMLMAVCLVVKMILYCYCKVVARKQASEIVKALAADHVNDIATNAMIIGTMAVVSWAQGNGHEGPLLAKLDPAVSLGLALWIIYGWVTNALDQVKALSDRKAEGEDIDLARVREAASVALQGIPLECRGADAYFAGEGFRVRVDLRPAAGSLGESEERVAAALARLRAGVVEAAGDSEVLSVETCILPRDGAGSLGKGQLGIGA